MRLAVDGHRPADEAGIQAAGRAGQAHDRAPLGGEEVLQPRLLGAVAALVDGDAARGRQPARLGRAGPLLTPAAALPATPTPPRAALWMAATSICPSHSERNSGSQASFRTSRAP